ncbi:WYL domain-containing protein [Granulicoccus phenolivorans]|uniref:WYL domain-containing protein n=1 Tax=Granulicoccus phenolivorans TaxID=266854 RepID=UPI00041C9E3C|nr:WYL domain-containing protein [Granulicoccus phenolivorans]
MSTSADQVARLLALVPYVQANPGISVKQVAREFGIAPRQVVKDLQVAYMCGRPGGLPGDLIEVDMEAVESDGVIHLDNAEELQRPMRLRADEALSLTLGLQSVREVAPPQLTGHVDSALAKLQGAAGAAADRTQVRVLAADEAVRRTIGDAIGGDRRLRLVYDAPTGTTTRTVDPLQVSSSDGYAYLQAWSEVPDTVTPAADGRSAPGWRHFRLDRIAEATVLEAPRHTHSTRPEPLDGWLDRVDSVAEVTLELGPEAAWAVDYYPMDLLSTGADGSVRVRVRVAEPLWLRNLLLRLAGGVRRVDPPKAADSARAAAAEALARYEQLGLGR